MRPGSYFNANPSFNPGASYRVGDFLLAADAIDPRARVQKPPDAPEEPGTEPPDAGGAEVLAPDEGIDPQATTPVDSTGITV